jgi:hypothetical protein
MAQRQSQQVQAGADQTSGFLGTRLLSISGFNLGEFPLLMPRLIPEEGLAEAKNCCYKNGFLYLGRPGLARISSTPIVEETISCVLPKDASSIYVATNKSVYNFDLQSGIFTKLFDVEGAAYLFNFMDDLIVCDGGRLKRWDGASLFICGSHYDGLLNAATQDAFHISGLSLTSTNSRVGISLTPSSYKRRINSFGIWIKEVSAADGSLVASIYEGTTLIADSTTTYEAASLTSSYTQMLFEFNGVELDANTTYYVVVRCLNRTTGESSVAEISGGPLADGGSVYYDGAWKSGHAGYVLYATVNGTGKPAPTFGIVARSRIFLAAAPEVWYSGVRDVDDFWQGGGFFTFGDDGSSSIEGMVYWDDRLFVSGICRGAANTILYKIDPIDSLAEVDRLAHGGKLFVINEALYIVGNGWVGVHKIDETGSRTLYDVSGLSISASELSNPNAFYYHQDRHVIIKGQTANVLFVMAINRFDPSKLGGPWVRYVFANINPVYLCESGGRLFLAATNGHIYEFLDNQVDDDGDRIEVSLKTGDLLLGSSFTRKVLRGVYIETDGDISDFISLRCFVDGVERPSFQGTFLLERMLKAQIRISCRTVQIQLISPIDDVNKNAQLVQLGPLTLIFTDTAIEPTM